MFEDKLYFGGFDLFFWLSQSLFPMGADGLDLTSLAIHH